MAMKHFTIASWCMVVLLGLSLLNIPQTIGQEGDIKSSIKKEKGVETVEFDTLVGTVQVNFPDDMSDTDTISGTVLVEAKGETKEEIAQNEDTLRGYVVEIEKTQEVPEPPPKCQPPVVGGGIKSGGTAKAPPPTCPPRKPNPPNCPPRKPLPPTTCPPGGTAVKSGGTCTGEPPTIYVVPGSRGGFTAAVPPKCGGVGVVVKNSGGRVICALPVPTNPIPPRRPPGCVFPPTCTGGGPLCIPNPSTGCVWTGSVKVNGQTCPPICKSPRQTTCQTPGTCRGPCTVTLTENGKTNKGTITFLPPPKTQPQPPASKPNPPATQDQLVFRRTGPFVTGKVEFSGYENDGYQWRVEGNQMIFTGYDEKKPVQAIVHFTPPPEILRPGDTFTVSASVDGPEYRVPISGPRGCYYPDYNWLKPTDGMGKIPQLSADPPRDGGSLSASYTYTLANYEDELNKRRKLIKDHAKELTPAKVAEYLAQIDQNAKKAPSLSIQMMSLHDVHVQWVYVLDNRRGVR